MVQDWSEYYQNTGEKAKESVDLDLCCCEAEKNWDREYKRKLLGTVGRARMGKWSQ